MAAGSHRDSVAVAGQFGVTTVAADLFDPAWTAHEVLGRMMQKVTTSSSEAHRLHSWIGADQQSAAAMDWLFADPAIRAKKRGGSVGSKTAPLSRVLELIGAAVVPELSPPNLESVSALQTVAARV